MKEPVPIVGVSHGNRISRSCHDVCDGWMARMWERVTLRTAPERLVVVGRFISS